MYVLSGARERCQADTGILLSYYSNYNASWFQPERYAATVSMVDEQRVHR